MNISVEYKDSTGAIHYQTHNLSRLAFVKHMAIAGQGYAPRPQRLLRTISMLFHYSYYTQRQSFNNNRFSEPPIELSDPTEKGQFSNLAGKAIADFLSKRIDHSILTVNYEAAMRLHNPPLPLMVEGRQVRRPDLLAYTSNSKFAVEAKGFSGGPGNMINHKDQSQSGRIEVDFTIASVAYNLYNQVKCKYHDPSKISVPYDKDLLISLSQNYYSGLSEFLNEKIFKYSEVKFKGEEFYEVELSPRLFEKYFSNQFTLKHFWYFELLDYYRPRLILPIAIQNYARYGITNETKPFIFDTLKEEGESLYIDNDRVGLQIRI